MDADQFKPNTLSRSVEDEDHFVFVCPQDMTITRKCSELFWLHHLVCMRFWARTVY